MTWGAPIEAELALSLPVELGLHLLRGLRRGGECWLPQVSAGDATSCSTSSDAGPVLRTDGLVVLVRERRQEGRDCCANWCQSDQAHSAAIAAWPGHPIL